MALNALDQAAIAGMKVLEDLRLDILATDHDARFLLPDRTCSF